MWLRASQTHNTSLCRTEFLVDNACPHFPLIARNCKSPYPAYQELLSKSRHYRVTGAINPQRTRSISRLPCPKNEHELEISSAASIRSARFHKNSLPLP